MNGLCFLVFLVWFGFDEIRHCILMSERFKGPWGFGTY